MKIRIIFFLMFSSYFQTWALNTDEISYINELLKTTNAKNNYNVTIEQKNNVLLYAKEKGNQQLYIKQLIDLGKTYDSLSIYDKAIEYYFKAINESDNYAGFKNIFGVSQPWVLVDLGNALFKLSYYKEAIDCFKQASIYFKNNCNIPAIVTCYTNIGMCYLNKLSPSIAMSYFQRSRKLGVFIKREDLIAKSDIYIGMCYEGLNNRKEALRAMNNAINYYTLVNDQYNIILANYDLATIFYEAEKYDSALTFYNNVQLYGNNDYSLDIVLSAILFKAKCYSKIAGIKKAISTLIPIESKMKQTRNNDLLLDFYKTLYSFYNKIGDYKSALKYHECLSNLTDSLNLFQKNKDIAVYQFRIKSDVLDSKIELLEETNNLILLEKNMQRNLAYFLIFSSIVLISISLGSKKKLSKKIELIKDYVESMDPKDKAILLIFTVVYFFLFFFIFKPTGFSPAKNISFFSFRNILPGLLSIIIIPISYLIVFKFRKRENKKKSNILIKMIVFAVMVFGFVTSGIYLDITHMKFILLTSQEILLILMVVLASIILPFFLSLTIIDNYILKRMAFNAIKLTNEIKSINVNNDFIPDNEVTFSTSKTKEKFTVNINLLIAIQAQGNYCKFFYADGINIKTTMLLITIKSTEELLLFDPRFIRCHKSHIVNINYINFISGNSRGYQISIKMLDFKIPASRGYQSLLKTRIEELKNEKMKK